MIRRSLALLTASSAFLLAACAQDETVSSAPDMGNATPVASPPAENPDGEVLALGEVSDLVRAGDRLAARVDDELQVGTLDEFRAGEVENTDISGCTDVTATESTITVTCGSEVRFFGDTEETVALEAPAQTAVVTTTGEVITGMLDEEAVQVYRDGELVEEFDVAGSTDQLLALPREDREDAVLRLDRAETRIQDVRWTEGQQGGTLRVGLGVGTMAPGENGLAIVTDTLGSQIMVYTVNDVVRLHQTAPVPESPWAAAWDGRWAWVASTADNTATAYDISGGVPVQESEVSTIADVRSMVATPDGLVLGGGDGLQIIPAV